MKAYLHKAAVNKTLNYIRSKKLDFESDALLISLSNNEPTPLQNLAADELKEKISVAIDDLPERCRLIFGLSRFEDMPYKQIAHKLNISVKTVENQMSKALAILRSKLLPVLIGFLFSFCV